MNSIRGTRFSRRSLLVRGTVIVGSVTLAPLLAACGSAAAPPVSTPAAAAPAAPAAASAATPTTAPAAAAAPAPANKDPLHVFAWAYHPEIIQENLDKYAPAYNEPKVIFEQAPTGSVYLNLLTAKFLGGETIDLAYIDQPFANRLYKAGYTRDLEEFPETPEIKKGIFKLGLDAQTGTDGKLIGLPYWSGPEQLVMNTSHMEKAGLKDPPKTWAEFVDMCKTIKGKGVAEFPYLPQWVKQSSQMDWNLYAECFSEGDYLFDENFAPTFKDGGTALRSTLERWKMLFDAKMVPPDVFTVQNEGIQAYATGVYTFHYTHEYDQKVYNDPKQSKMAGFCKNIYPPGKVGTSFGDAANYAMGKKNHGPERAWTLLRWFGWKDPTNKQFNVDMNWAFLEGLGTVIKEIAADPKVVEDWSKWKDVKLYAKEMDEARLPTALKQLWFNEWNENMMGVAQDAIAGKVTIDDAIKNLYESASSLQKSYPKV